jgi:Ca2+-transporting ATPase
MAVAVVLTQLWASKEGYDTRQQQTIVFTLLCFVQLTNALSVRFTYHSIFSSALFANRIMWFAIALTVLLQLLIVYLPFTEEIFKTSPLDWKAMLMILSVTVVCLLGIELVKLFSYRLQPRTTGGVRKTSAATG